MNEIHAYLPSRRTNTIASSRVVVNMRMYELPPGDETQDVPLSTMEFPSRRNSEIFGDENAEIDASARLGSLVRSTGSVKSAQR